MQKGVYRHYSGKEYLVLGEILREVDLTPLVVYQALYDDYTFWARPKEEFLEVLSSPHYSGPRFTFIRKWTAADEEIHSHRPHL